MFLLRIGCLALWFCVTAATAANLPPAVPREFRGAWVPSVGNIQWPSKPGLPPEIQRAELLEIFNRAQQLNLNAIILQVRPTADALYSSGLEPWSEYLTGKMGKPPSPFYDPLAYAVVEAHKRGLELHAWINPFRARIVTAKSPISSNHISKQSPGLIVPYGKYLWLDPGQRAARDHSIKVIEDIVRRYDIDGLHMDDYFYPYAERDAAKRVLPFRDDASWQSYRAQGGKMERGDWRRQNVNQFVQQAYVRVKALKPWVKFGVSPFGIWKPGYPATISLKSGNMYEEIYCDSLKWWRNGWMDYLSPQLYWPIEPADQSFTALLGWWSQQNTQRRNLWPGMNTAQVGGKWRATEIMNQIQATRTMPGVSGHIHWSMRSITKNLGTIAETVEAAYLQPVLIPASPWLDKTIPPKPQLKVSIESDGLKSAWEPRETEVTAWVFQYRIGKRWKTEILPRGEEFLTLGPQPAPVEVVAISVVNRFGSQSAPSVYEVPPRP